MATSTESNPPAKDPNPGNGPAAPKPATVSPAAAATARPAARADSASKSGPSPGDPRGLSSLSESILEKSLLRRGFVTPEELAAGKAHREKLSGSKDTGRGLLEILVAGKVLTISQANRLIKEVGSEAPKKLDIPGYTEMQKLGKGSMGVVYRAKQTSMDRIVAIKVLLDSLSQNKEFIGRFQREAKIAARLQHNHIVNAIDAGEVDGHHYFVMEYVEGTTIKDELEKGRKFTEPESLKIVMAVAEALKHASERGLIHRDVKPENVIITQDGQVKLADLGLARLTTDEQQAMSEAGMAIGTPYYISPEQVRGQIDVDIRGDIYSLGATLYHMVTGVVPYDGQTPSEVMKKHIDKKVNFIPPDHVNTTLSSGLGEVVETMMAKDRNDRYRTPDDLILDLKCLLQGERPIIAQGKADGLADLADGDMADDEYAGPAMTDAAMVESAAYVNSRTTIIVVLAILLAVSVVSNVLVLVTR